MLQFLFLVACLISTHYTTVAKQNAGIDLPPDSDLRIGIKYRPTECPRKSKHGDSLQVHYDGMLYKNNKKFDSSRDREEPFRFTVGEGRVIKGWDRGMLGMCIGERRKLVVPADLGYGDVGAGHDIPGGATLVFEVELLNIFDEDEEEDAWEF